MTFKAFLATSAFLVCAGPSLALAQAAPSPMPPMGHQGPFERADANKDGVITRDEVRIARTAAFTRLDANRDGFLERAEIRKGRGEGGPGGRDKMGKSHGGGDHGDMFGEADANKDGNVSQAEFNAMGTRMHAQRMAQHETRHKERFARLDTNRDGNITQAEAQAARAAMGAGRPPRVDADTNKDKKISLAEWLARPDPLFERADANKDGQVTRAEAATTMREGRGHKGRPGRGW